MWLILLVVSVVVALLGVYFGYKKKKYTHFIVILSLCLGMATLYTDYAQVCNWVVEDNVTALLDVVPSMAKIMLNYVVVLFTINGVALFISILKK